MIILIKCLNKSKTCKEINKISNDKSKYFHIDKNVIINIIFKIIQNQSNQSNN